jgi:intracellular septation protein
MTKFLFDFFPVLAFFVAFYIPEDRSQGIYLATAVAIVAGFIQIGGYWFLTRKVEKMHLITLAILVLLGGLTLLLQDERFIKWKPTAVYWLFTAVLLGGHYLFGRNLIQSLLGHAIQLPPAVWNNLNNGWAAFFFITGIINLYVAYSFNNVVWVNFKMFGLLGLTLLFAVAQAFYMNQYIIEPEKGQ